MTNVRPWTISFGIEHDRIFNPRLPSSCKQLPKVKRNAIKLKPNVAYNTLHAIGTEVKTCYVLLRYASVSSYLLIMVNKRVQFMISFIVLFKLRRQDTCIIWHWFEFSYKMWSMLIIHFSYLHIQKKQH